MALPASNDTRANNMVFVEKINQNVYRIYNGSGVAISQGDYLLINGFFGVALQDAAATEYFDMQVDDEIELHANSDNFKSGASTFGTLYQTVYWNQNNEEFDDTGYGVAVGKLSQIKDSDGMIKFFNLKKVEMNDGEQLLKYTIAADATGGLDVDYGYNFEVLDVLVNPTAAGAHGGIQVQDSAGNEITNHIPIVDEKLTKKIEYTIAADLTAGLDVDFGYNFEVLDVKVNPTAAGAHGSVQLRDSTPTEITNIIPIGAGDAPRRWVSYSIVADATLGIDVDFGYNFTIEDVLVHPDISNAGGTVLLSDSAGNAITDAMVAAVVDVPARPALIDGANGYNVIADGTVKFTTNGAADRATVHMLIKPTLTDREDKAISISAATATIADGIINFITGDAADRAVITIEVQPTITDRIFRADGIVAANAEVSDGTVKFVTENAADRAVVYLRVKAV